MSHNTLARDDELQYQIWLQKVQKFRSYGLKILFNDLSSHCDLYLEDRNPIFSHDTLGHDDAQSDQVSLGKVQIFPEHLNPHSDLNRDSNPKLSYNTPARDDAPLYKIWLENVHRK